MPKYCNFCATKTTPDFKDVDVLRNYVDEKSKRIRPSEKTGTCPKHQRVLRLSIIIAREMALLPYIQNH